DCVQQRDAVLGQKLRALAEEGIVKVDPDMFEHADRYDSIKSAVHITIVQKLEFDVSAAALLRPVLGALVLFLRQRNAGDLRAGDLGQLERQSAPAAADVEHLGAGRDPQLGGEVTLLCQLRVIKRLIEPLEIGAAILLVTIEE